MTKKLLIAIITISILSLSVIFSGCAKTQPQGTIGFLSRKVHNWQLIGQKNPKEFKKYNKICNGLTPYIFQHKYMSNHNVYMNCQYINSIQINNATS